MTKHHLHYCCGLTEQVLSITQPIAHYPPSQWDRGENWKKKIEIMS